MPKQLTNEQVRERLLRLFAGMVDYWEKEAPPQRTLRERLNGLAFSMLAALDGESPGVPGFIVAPSPHKTDREYLQGQGRDWFPETPAVPTDIAGSLHEKWPQFER
jgi:hypothetical protein